MDSRKEEHVFRTYENDPASRIRETYKKMHENQNVLFVKSMKKKYASPEGYTTENGEKIREAFIDVFAELDKIIDESDPDTDTPQIYHAYQTGEALRLLLDPSDPTKLRNDIYIKDYFSEKEWEKLTPKDKEKFQTTFQALYPHIKDWSWLPLVGFMHDMGKVLATDRWGKLPQWAVVGDTFPVGAPFSSANVYYNQGFFKTNPDLTAKTEKYKEHCGFKKVKMSFGHDEYFYRILKRTQHHLPREALYMIRFHSFYPWHTSRSGERGYEELASKSDRIKLPLLKLLQRCDLYSKKDKLPNPEQLKSDYMTLIEKFIPSNEQPNYAPPGPAKILW